jgi:peroxidase
LARWGGPRRIWQLGGGLVVLAAIVVAVPVVASPNDPDAGQSLEQLLQDARTLDGQGNNPNAGAQGAAGTPYLRIADAAYPDGVAAMMQGPSERAISNRILNDVGQNLFSENDASQWVWIWGQFIDHDIDLRDATPGESAPLPFDASDPLERFQNDFGVINFARTPAAPGTGTDTPREQINQISSFIDASNIYGVDPIRLDWLREGPVDGDPTNNSAKLLMPEGFLPRMGDRDDKISAPLMELDGPLREKPELARIAGDQRANENMALTLVQTLWAREHNRIVDRLPDSLSEEQKFQIARRVVGAEIQYITYNEFLPAVGVALPEYQGYDQNVNPSVSNEFATVGYRAHSMVHGVFNPPFSPGDFTQEQLQALISGGVGVSQGANGANFLDIPLTAMFGNPDLLGQVGIGRLAVEFAAGHQYRNDEQIDETMRSVLFQVPKPGSANPEQCGQPVVVPDCFTSVMDLGAIDIARGRDHGIPTYNALRQAYGLAPLTSFTEITGENQSEPANGTDPSILDFVQLSDINGNVINANDQVAVEEQAVTGVRRTTLASRLEAVYGSVDAIDAFVGMQAEAHPEGAELGALQRAMWRDQFTRLRDGDRYFYANDPALGQIAEQLGIDYRITLAQLIELNTGGQTQPNAFRSPPTG